MARSEKAGHFNMQCFSPISITVRKDGAIMNMMVPCNKCLGCRIARRREWSVRILHELMSSDHSGVFLTLTYDDEHIPICASLDHRDVQKFFKRWRKLLSPKRIRYYMCGEYGDGGRPHYHMIVFGIDLDDMDVYYVGNKKMVSGTIDKVWPFGYNQVGTVTSASAQYVAGYIEKKLYGDIALEEYDSKGRKAPYSAMSQGIGARWCDENKSQLGDNLELTVKGMYVGIPRYYKKRANIDPLKLYEKGQEMRDKISARYRVTYEKGGIEAADRLRSDIASYRYQAYKAAYLSRRRESPLNGDLTWSPSRPAKAGRTESTE